MEGQIRRGWIWRFWGAPIFRPEAPKPFKNRYLGTSGLKIGAPQKRQILPRRIWPPICGPLSTMLLGWGGCLHTVTVIRQPRDQQNNDCQFHLEIFPPNSLCTGSALRKSSPNFRKISTTFRRISAPFPDAIKRTVVLQISANFPQNFRKLSAKKSPSLPTPWVNCWG